MQDEKSFKYYAFISYSHKDKKIAKQLQKFLERYRLPSVILKSHKDLPKRLNPVFMDESNLVGVALHDALRENLERSNYLILICSPNSAKSEYVNDEVKYFIEHGRANKIVPLIIDGVPHAENKVQECFVKALLDLPREQELLGIDLNKFGTRKAFLRVIATLLNLDLDYFVSWIEKLRRRRNLIFAAAAVVMIILVLIFKPWEYVDRAIELNTAENQLNLAIKNYRNKDYKHAAEWLEKSAAQGNANAQFMLGSFYEEGLGVPQDHKRAFELFRKAAEQGHAYSQFDLGRRYEKGLGVSQDYKQAAEWYSKSAAQGNVSAQNNLGTMYLNGQGVKRDYKKALEFFSKAASQDNANAQNNLGSMYVHGEGVSQDYKQALEWFEKAAAQGDADAQNNLGMMYVNGEGVSQDYKIAFGWFEKSAAQGYPKAHLRLGVMYEHGRSVEQNLQTAYMYYYLAYLGGDEDAPENLKTLEAESRLTASQIAKAKEQAQNKFKEFNNK